MLSQGVPMLLAGDEMGRSQGGNNNTYCHDDALSWIDWELTAENKSLLRYSQKLIKLIKASSYFLSASLVLWPRTLWVWHC